jgi:uncharacterized protein (TIGR02246 family)
MPVLKLLRIGVMSLAVSCLAGNALAADTSAALQKQLQARLDYVYGPVWAKGDADLFVKEFLTDDAIITASDGPTVWNSKPANVELIKELMKSISALQATAVYTRALGPRAAMQFVVFKLTARDPAQQKSLSAAKSLYVWVKTPQGWRVAADHYSYATMEMPH